MTIESGAQFNFSAVANRRLPAGRVFTAINNTAASPISGSFANLADDSIFTAGGNSYQVITPAATGTISPSWLGRENRHRWAAGEGLDLVVHFCLT